MRHFRLTGLSALTIVGLLAAFTYAAPESSADPVRAFSFSGFVWGQNLHTKVGVNSQAWNRKQNLVKRDGSLYVTTARYCTKAGGEPGKGAAAHPGVCPATKHAAYATGRAQVGGITLGNDFSVSFTADLPGKVAPGSRMALWMVHGPYCDGDSATPEPSSNASFGELDVLEWYSRDRTRSNSTTHVACDVSRTEEFLSDPNVVTIPNRTKSYTWKVERHGDVLRYYRNGVRLGNKQICGAARLTSTTTPPDCAASLAGPWTLIIQGEVFAQKCTTSGCGPLTRPSDRTRFPTQVLRVRDVTVIGAS